MSSTDSTAPSAGPAIAGYDGSEASKAALRLAELLAPALRSDVVAATVYRTIPYVLAPGASSMADAELVDELRKEALELLARLDVADVRKVAVAGQSAAQGLHRLAEEQGARLLAVGVSHRGAVGRLLVGGVGDRLLHGAPCPVAVVPARWADQPCQTLGVAYDGRPEAKVAIAAAEDLARRLQARLVVIGVYDPAPYLWLTSPAPAPAPWDVDELHRIFDQEVQGVVDELDPAVRPERRVLAGLPGPTLVEASRQGIDLLVTGSRGYGPLGSVLLGSVSRYLADHAACPVLVVPRAAATEDVDAPVGAATETLRG